MVVLIIAANAFQVKLLYIHFNTTINTIIIIKKLLKKGSYCPGGNSSVSCPPGTYNSNYQSTNSSACTPCSQGTYSISGQSVCTLCSQGTYNPVTGQSNCIACSAGTCNPNEGGNSSSACIPCSLGTWFKTSAPSGYWVSIASDSSGQYLAAVQKNGGYIYSSSSG